MLFERLRVPCGWLPVHLGAVQQRIRVMSIFCGPLELLKPPGIQGNVPAVLYRQHYHVASSEVYCSDAVVPRRLVSKGGGLLSCSSELRAVQCVDRCQIALPIHAVTGMSQQ